jgi:hypothetical protein
MMISIFGLFEPRLPKELEESGAIAQLYRR